MCFYKKREFQFDHIGETAEEIASINGLRGVAISLVLWHHAILLFLDDPQTNGWMGVDLFFVISGFLITSILLRAKKRRQPMWVFWARRSLRILPLAFVFLGILFLLSRYNIYSKLSCFTGWSWFWVFAGNFHIASNGWSRGIALNQLWSLAIEEQFYLFWPFIVRYLAPKKLAMICGLILIQSIIFRWFAFVTDGYPAVYVLTWCRIDGLATGALLALGMMQPHMGSRLIGVGKKLFPLACLGIGIFMFLQYGHNFAHKTPQWWATGAYTLISGCFAVILLASLAYDHNFSRIMENPVLIWMGRRCYGLYLFHCLIGEMVIQLFSGRAGWPGFCLWVVICALITEASFRWLEGPILSLKDRLIY